MPWINRPKRAQSPGSAAGCERGARTAAPAALGTLLLLSGSPAPAWAAAPTVSGLWDATVQSGSLQIPFRFGIGVRGDVAHGWFYNGGARILSSHGRYLRGHLTLDFGSYARRLDATLRPDGSLQGVYGPTTPGSTDTRYEFHATRSHPPAQRSTHAAPSIAGLWLVPTPSGKAGERAWRLTVHQAGAQVTAAMLRVDGDSGALTGAWREGRLVLSHFDGARPALIEVTALPDGTLRLVLHRLHDPDVTLSAYRLAAARARGLPHAADPTLHTRVRDAAEPFRFRFPDLNGRIVSSTDRRFRGKVLLVDIAGSWCPNCHDEAPFLESLYERYRARGLRVVTLAFEEPDQLADPVGLKAFIKQYHISYTVLLAGSPDQLHQKLPQAIGLDAYPTTFFIARDGRVRAVHAGYAAPATGEFHARVKREFTRQIERLLSGTVD
ncbi:MAG TPA: TlpA disulfide reductase family protein [Steroidobacteraceae bacterium]|nr:TlpA disulfide reductase family protein [Steroidobacteraceae bacterium]